MNAISESPSMGWISDDLDKSINTARLSFESFLSGSAAQEGEAQLQTAYDHTTACVKIFESSGLDAAKQLAAAIGDVLQGLLNNTLDNQQDAFQVVIGGYNQLTNYLCRLKRNGDEPAVHVLPVLNDILSVLGKPLYLPTDQFVLAETPDTRSITECLASTSAESTCASVCRSLDSLAASHENQPAVMQSLHDALSSINSDNELLLAMRDIASMGMEEKKLGVSARYALSRAVSLIDGRIDIEHAERIFKECLYSLSCNQTKVESQLATKYGLCNALQTESLDSLLHLGTPDIDTITIVLEGLLSDIAKVQLALQSCAESEGVIDDAHAIVSVASNIQYTLKMIQHNTVAHKLNDVVEELNAAEQAGRIDGAALENVVATLFEIEQLLIARKSGSGRDASELSVLEQLRVTVAELRSSLDTLVGDADASDLQQSLEDSCQRIATVNGACRFLVIDGLAEVAEALGDHYVNLANACVEQGATPELLDSARQLTQLYGQFEVYLGDVAQSNHTLVARQLTSIADDLGISSAALNDGLSADAHAQAPDTALDANSDDTSLSENVIEDTASATEEAAIPASNAVAYVEQPLECELDDDIVEIFLEEAEEVFESINECFSVLNGDSSQESALADLRRGYHTLKGSGRMAGAEDVGNAAWAIENMLNRVIEGGGSCSDARLQIVGEANQYMAILIGYFARRVKPYVPALESIIHRADALADDENAAVVQGESLLLEQAKDTTTAEQLVDSRDTVVDEHADDLEALSDELASGSDLVDETAVEAIADEEAVGEKPVIEETPDVSADDAEFVMESVLDEDSGELNECAAETTEADEPVIQPESESEQLANLRSIFIEELKVQMAVLEAFCQSSEHEDEIAEPDESLKRCIHTLVGGARIAELDDWATLLAPAEKLVAECQRKQSMNDEQFAAVRQLHDELTRLSMGELESGASVTQLAAIFEQLLAKDWSTESISPTVEEVAESVSDLSDHCQWVFDWPSLLRSWRVSGSAPEEATAMAAELAQIEEDSHAEPKIVELCQQLRAAYAVCHDMGLHREAFQVLSVAHEELVSALDDLAIGEPVTIESIDSLSSFVAAEHEVQSQQQAAVTRRAGSQQSDVSEIDREIVDIFLEESVDLIEELETTIASWLDDRQALELLEALLRPLHTLKGGARMAGLESIGNCCHEFETEIQAVKLGETKVSASFAGQVQKRLVELNTEFAKITDDGGTANNEQQGEKEPVEKRIAEMVRVPSDLLDNLVNLAGETSISRSLVEEHLADFTRSIDEVEETVDRLKEQLRRLEIETEAQIAFRREKVEIEGLEEFDPLEMDRYSQFQQLSKSLVESASDLKDLKSTLREKTRDVETLLLQQSRINTELQEGLMRTRTVPLSRTVVPRLRKTVRQVSGELDKLITFNVGNTDGELDKSVIERMVAPLEHVLRNAIDHGIESVADREKAGKPAAGAIRMTIDREASDVVIKISDDGKGIDTRAVRKKAIEKGVISESQQLSEEELQQLIFAQGFSTAESVTQISGRGVGMDVVRSEIAELGGTVELQSTKGQGTTFVFRLPFTMSMNRALLVSAGGESIAVPLDTIEGIVRLSPYELNEYYGEDAVDFMYAGQTYDFHYLGAALNGSKPQYSTDMIGALPVLLVRNKQRLLAYQVDRLLGSREIVVKSLGPQFTGLEGINGATVLGDGSVVMIADLGALAQNIDVAVQHDGDQSSDASATSQRDRALVMVVDDSVTVRKVTTRLLEREGFEVITAKDGQDAMDQLEDIKPDVMLLDIEMPRLDGFEVVSRVRHDNRLADLPIIMISSRTGDKHRERAVSLGANEFLGKPYQDQVLMQTIARVAPGVAAFLSVAP